MYSCNFYTAFTFDDLEFSPIHKRVLSAKTCFMSKWCIASLALQGIKIISEAAYCRHGDSSCALYNPFSSFEQRMNNSCHTTNGLAKNSSAMENMPK